MYNILHSILYRASYRPALQKTACFVNPNCWFWEPSFSILGSQGSVPEALQSEQNKFERNTTPLFFFVRCLSSENSSYSIIQISKSGAAYPNVPIRIKLGYGILRMSVPICYLK